MRGAECKVRNEGMRFGSALCVQLGETHYDCRMRESGLTRAEQREHQAHRGSSALSVSSPSNARSSRSHSRPVQASRPRRTSDDETKPTTPSRHRSPHASKSPRAACLLTEGLSPRRSRVPSSLRPFVPSALGPLVAWSPGPLTRKQKRRPEARSGASYR
jgi:hypothetical protein